MAGMRNVEQGDGASLADPLAPANSSEVHRQAGTWFDKREICAWFAANLHRVRDQDS
jgi:hypothetical protein